MRSPVFVTLLVVSLQIIQCLGNLALMPFHIENNGGYCIETKKKIKYNKKKYDHLIIQFTAEDAIQFWLNDGPNWNNAVEYSFPPERIRFNDKADRMIVLNGFKPEREQQWAKKMLSVKNTWILGKKSSDSSSNAALPIKVALQRMQVMIHPLEYITSDDVFSRSVLEDGVTLAALSMLSYYEKLDDLEENAAFYGGTIAKRQTITDVAMATELPSHWEITQRIVKTVDVGPLKLFSWTHGDIFVVAIRGTVDDGNWHINFKIKADEIEFRGYGGNSNATGAIHSGIYAVVNENLDEFLSVFEPFANEKRIILTGHSLGSGLAQGLLLHMLNLKNKDNLTTKVRDIIYRDSATDSVGCSLEIKTFAGPAMMDKSLTKALKKALDAFNENAEHNPGAEYSATIFYKENDPISKSGEESYRYMRRILSYHEGKGTVADIFFKRKAQMGKYKDWKRINYHLGWAGMADLLKYEHFGNAVVVGQSPYNPWGETFHLFSHGEYLEANFFYIKKKGVDGWISGEEEEEKTNIIATKPTTGTGAATVRKKRRVKREIRIAKRRTEKERRREERRLELRRGGKRTKEKRRVKRESNLMKMAERRRRREEKRKASQKRRKERRGGGGRRTRRRRRKEIKITTKTKTTGKGTTTKTTIREGRRKRREATPTRAITARGGRKKKAKKRKKIKRRVSASSEGKGKRSVKSRLRVKMRKKKRGKKRM